MPQVSKALTAQLEAPARLGQLVSQETTDLKVKLELLVTLARTESRAITDQPVQQETMAPSVTTDPLDQPDLPDPLDLRESSDLTALREEKDKRGNQDPLVMMGL